MLAVSISFARTYTAAYTLHPPSLSATSEKEVEAKLLQNKNISVSGKNVWYYVMH